MKSSFPPILQSSLCLFCSVKTISSRYLVKAIGQGACPHLEPHHPPTLPLLFSTFSHHRPDSRTGLHRIQCKDQVATHPLWCITAVERAGVSPQLDHRDHEVPHSPCIPAQEAPATQSHPVGALPFCSCFVPRNSSSKLAFQLSPLARCFFGRGTVSVGTWMPTTWCS